MPRTMFASHHMKTVNTILVPVDFSEYESVAIEYATWLAKQFDAKLIIAHVTEPISAYFGQMYWGMTISAAADRQKRLESIVPTNATVPYEHVMLSAENVALTEAGDIAAEICRYAESAAVDLIVIASHGRSGISDALVGSVASHVIRQASCPTMIVKPYPDTSHA